MLGEEIKRRMLAAMKSGDVTARNVLRVALGEVQGDETTKGRKLHDDEVAQILRKLVKSNQESIAAGGDEARRSELGREIAVLEDLLPRTLDVAAIRAALAPVAEAILAAKSDGQATGVAMKHLKAAGAAVTGQDVAEAVRAMRG